MSDDIQGHSRFGDGRDGQLVVDDDEWRFREDLDSVPDEVRALFDLGWCDLSDDDAEPKEDDIQAVD